MPSTDGQVIRIIYESLAFKYRYVLEALVNASGHSVDTLHIIGGGAQNEMLCQMTADAIGRRVIAGPNEATGIGNAMMQLIAMNELADMSEARSVLRQTVDVQIYEPQDRSRWDEANARFKQMIDTIETLN